MQLVPVVPYVKLENRIYQDYDINLNICNSSIYQHCYTELQYIQWNLGFYSIIDKLYI